MRIDHYNSQWDCAGALERPQCENCGDDLERETSYFDRDGVGLCLACWQDLAAASHNGRCVN